MIRALRIRVHQLVVRRTRARLHTDRLAGNDTPARTRDALARISTHLIRITDLRTSVTSR